MKDIPEHITVICRANGQRARGLLVLLAVHMNRKNDYHLISRPTFNGLTEFRREDVECEAKRLRDAFPMDYEELAQGVQGFSVSIMDDTALRNVLRALELYGEDSPMYRQGLQDQVTRALELLGKQYRGKALEVEVAEPARSSGTWRSEDRTLTSTAR